MPSTNPRVSVLIPTYNSARYVGHALESLLTQSMPNWEAVVVDNASTDGTLDIAQRYSAKDSRIRVARNDVNLGPLQNWRRCALLARSERAGLLFSDDWYESEFLKRSMDALDAAPSIGFVYCAVRIVKEAVVPGKPVAHVAYRLERDGVYDANDYLRSLYELRGLPVPVSPGCALMRTADLRRWLAFELANDQEMGYARHGAGPDVAIYIQACLEYDSFAHIREPLVCFRAHESNLTFAPGVAHAYASALREFYGSHVARMALDAARVDGVLAYRLRKARIGKQLMARLSPCAWVHFAAIAARSVLTRVRGWWIASETASARPDL